MRNLEFLGNHINGLSLTHYRAVQKLTEVKVCTGVMRLPPPRQPRLRLWEADPKGIGYKRHPMTWKLNKRNLELSNHISHHLPYGECENYARTSIIARNAILTV
jgi:hypothetical protein